MTTEMTPDRYAQVKKLFMAACDLDPEARARLLAHACREDAILRQEVEALLEHHVEETILTDHGDEPPTTLDAPEKVKLKRPPMVRKIASGMESATEDEAIFEPGDTVADRYRITHLLGRGGMGVVYRADDLTLLQPVALKFLPSHQAEQPQWLSLFLNEVKFAREVSHPNVCRVFDIGQSAGQWYLSMEYITGEDLESVLKRIGRLPSAKAIDLARQICMGLAAVHDLGILHRDLKPGNVMMDNEGEVKISDFGIASMIDVDDKGRLAGTLAYMAPELLLGHDATQASDIYSLGLLLYQLFTGKPAYEGKAASERERLVSPSSLVPTIRPEVERVIMQCLEKDPGHRPQSAYEVAAALPGGDPLAAALAAGQTPSPSMVAAAGAGASAAPVRIATLALATVVLLVVLLMLAGSTFFVPQSGLDKSPDVLVDRAREVVQAFAGNAGDLGDAVDADSSGRSRGRGSPRYEHGRFVVEDDAVRFVDAQERGWDELPRRHPAMLQFWYRQGDERMAEARALADPTWVAEPALRAGMVRLKLDPSGRLTYFEAATGGWQAFTPADTANADRRDDGGAESAESAEPVDPAADALTADSSPGDALWAVVFKWTELDQAMFTPMSRRFTPPMFADEVRVWTGRHPDDESLAVELVAARLGGRIVFAEVIEPWRLSAADQARLAGTEFAESGLPAVGEIPLWATVVRGVVFLVVVVCGAALGWRNLQLNLADVVGARRLGIAVFVLGICAWVFVQRHTYDLAGETAMFYEGVSRAAFQGVAIWLFYLAVEPYVRRHWPYSIVAWSRILNGRVRDPAVGKSVLIGCLFGVAMVLALAVFTRLPVWLDMASRSPVFPGGGYDLGMLVGFRFNAGRLLAAAGASVTMGMAMLLLMLLLRRYTPTPVTVAGFVLVCALMFGLTLMPDLFLHWVLAFALPLAMSAMLLRAGLLALIVGLFTNLLLMTTPLTADVSQWYFSSVAFAVAIVLGLTAFGAYAAAQPLLLLGHLRAAAD